MNGKAIATTQKKIKAVLPDKKEHDAEVQLQVVLYNLERIFITIHQKEHFLILDAIDYKKSSHFQLLKDYILYKTKYMSSS